MIIDFNWLLDLKKIFKKHRYIIRVKPDIDPTDNEDNIADQLESLEQMLSIKVDETSKTVIERMESMKKNI